MQRSLALHHLRSTDAINPALSSTCGTDSQPYTNTRSFFFGIPAHTAPSGHCRGNSRFFLCEKSELHRVERHTSKKLKILSLRCFIPKDCGVFAENHFLKKRTLRRKRAPKVLENLIIFDLRWLLFKEKYVFWFFWFLMFRSNRHTKHVQVFYFFCKKLKKCKKRWILEFLHLTIRLFVFKNVDVST